MVVLAWMVAMATAVGMCNSDLMIALLTFVHVVGNEGTWQQEEYSFGYHTRIFSQPVHRSSLTHRFD